MSKLYHRTHHRKHHLWPSTLLLALLTVSALMLLRVGTSSPTIGKGSHNQTELSYRAARKIYPYSVIAGGILSIQELQQSIDSDPVVAQHYADVHIEDLVPRRLDRPIDAYVSYRVKNVVNWTHHRIRLPAGELLWVNERHMIRARCGNRVAFDVPPEISETSLPPIVPPEIVFEYGLPAVSAGAFVPERSQVVIVVPGTSFSGPFIYPFYCCGGGGGGGSTGGGGMTNIPEPSTLSLLGVSFLIWWAKERMDR